MSHGQGYWLQSPTVVLAICAGLVKMPGNSTATTLGANRNGIRYHPKDTGNFHIMRRWHHPTRMSAVDVGYAVMENQEPYLSINPVFALNSLIRASISGICAGSSAQ